jgi:hypothetical protein
MRIVVITKLLSLNINIINMCTLILTSELLRFLTIVKTLKSKIHSGYMLFNCRVSYIFINTYFIRFLRLVLQNCGILILNTADQPSNIMDLKHIYVIIEMNRITRNKISSGS